MALLHENAHFTNKTAVEIPQENFPFNLHVQKVILTSGPSISIIRFFCSYLASNDVSISIHSPHYMNAPIKAGIKTN
jgi:hypothetical protein